MPGLRCECGSPPAPQVTLADVTLQAETHRLLPAPRTIRANPFRWSQTGRAVWPHYTEAEIGLRAEVFRIARNFVFIVLYHFFGPLFSFVYIVNVY